MSKNLTNKKRHDNVKSQASMINIAAFCVAINVGLGTVASIIKLPVYLDATGTILIALLIGSRGFHGFILSATVGAISFGISGVLLNPALFWFIPTQVAIAFFSFYVARPILLPYIESGTLSSVKGAVAVIFTGITLGVLAGIVSAPIIAYVFGGITGSGASLVVALLLKSGQTLFSSVLYSGIASEPIDKTIQLIIALTVLRNMPKRLRSIFS